MASVLVITTSGERPLREVARDLAKAGLNVSEVLDEIGSIIGTADVSRDTSVGIGPPGAPETW